MYDENLKQQAGNQCSACEMYTSVTGVGRQCGVIDNAVHRRCIDVVAPPPPETTDCHSSPLLGAGILKLWNRYTHIAQGLDLQAMQYVSIVVRNVHV